MAIGRPEAIDGAPRRGLTAKEGFLVSRGMTAQPAGEESLTRLLRHRRSRRSWPSARSAHRRGRLERSRHGQITERWRPSHIANRRHGRLTGVVFLRQADVLYPGLLPPPRRSPRALSGARQGTGSASAMLKRGPPFRACVDPRHKRPSLRHETTAAIMSTAALILLTATTKIRPAQDSGRTRTVPLPFRQPARRR